MDKVAAAGTTLTIRPARAGEIAALEALIARSARGLSRGFYDDAQTEAAIAHVFGVDTDLVADGSYLVVEDASGAVIGCGGWSRRRTLFGGDNFAGRTPGFLDPAVDAARIRAFFVAPEAARRGVGAHLLDACEQAARVAGFTRAALMATLPGVPFYARHGYVGGDPVRLDLGGVETMFVPMEKTIVA
jgi:GNAT superfamily N-acetyltransferase